METQLIRPLLSSPRLNSTPQTESRKRNFTVFLNETAPLDWTDSLDYGRGQDAIWTLGTRNESLNESPNESLLSKDNTSEEKLTSQIIDQVESLDDKAVKSESRKVVVELPFSTLTQPASHYDGFISPATEESELRAVAALVESMGALNPDEGHIEFDLDSFSVYMDSSLFPSELRPLQHLASHGVSCMYFDGVLRHGNTKFYLRRIRFHKVPVGNYGDSNHTIGDQIWILSELNERLGREIYYKLRSPAPEYRRFHTPFLWIADLAKHVIDYCDYRRDQRRRDHRRRVVLHDFKSRFSKWALHKHRFSTVFEKWHSANGGADFRGALIANIDYIWKEAHGLDPDTSWHHIWREVKTHDHYQSNLQGSDSQSKRQHPLEKGPEVRKDNAVLKTIVTPYTYNLFSHMAFGELLESKEPATSVERRQATFVQETQYTRHEIFRNTRRSAADQIALIASIEPGDVISTVPDDASTKTRWKREASSHHQGEHLWFGLVQHVRQRPYGKRSFDVLWLYQPIDTPCSVMKYPWANELFLSDNCTCHRDMANVEGNEVLSTHEIEWFGSPSTSAEFFVRQTYVASDCRWTSLEKRHFVCGDESAFSQEPANQYCIGDAVLVDIKTAHLETFIIECFFEEGKGRFARMRRLWRRKDVDKDAHYAPPNELIYSQQLVEILAERIDRRCLIRAFHVDEKIPPPYNRNGTGDAFFITHQEIKVNGVNEYRPLESTQLESLRQGFNPSKNHKIQKLQGLDLFCGGGNFGRGIEEGGAVEMRWTNDIWEGAIHTYMANTPEPGSCTPLLGSVDDLLGLALEGDERVPTPGDVHFISGGSPCPGFSLLTKDKTTGPQRKNQSLVASFASFVDLYRPLYGLLENVPNMVNSSGFRNSCVFSQLVCALVGLGYQVRVLFLDAWSFGSAQNRTRVFLSFTAPGLQTPNAPKPSHSHPDNMPLHKLGEMSCGRPFDSRKRVPTPFKFTTMRDAIGDLPNIQDGKADYCVGYPDHRLSIGYTPVIRKQLEAIPTQPYGMNFSKAWWGRPGHPPVMTASERLLFPNDGQERVKKHSNGWGRVDPRNLIGTIPTTCMPTDSRIGRVCHWDQTRPMTILEARRAQGFPDNEVLVASRKDQYKIIGNSVSRQVALVLGLAIREAWLGTMVDDNPTERLAAQHDSDPDLTVQSVEAEEIEVDTDLQAEGHTILDEMSDSSEDPLALVTPYSFSVLTPATSESVEPSDTQLQRQPLIVQVLTKKYLRDFGADDLSMCE